MVIRIPANAGSINLNPAKLTVSMCRAYMLTACSFTLRAVACIAILLSAPVCHADEVTESPGYLREIRPILASHCFPCHGPDAASRQARLRLDQSAAEMLPPESGVPAIVPHQADQSELVRRIESSDTDLVMPPPDSKKQLTKKEMRLLRNWIASGAKYAEHWAFRSPERPPVPQVSRTSWIRNEIDAFVLSKLEPAGLQPAPEASPETLLRRVSLDLTGLPPTLDERQAFLDDGSATAWENAVDRLLQSPHFGEKLTQDWLDLARFGDTSGYQDDNDRPNYPYRDAVIRAFNQNLPFDQLTVASLAGDLLPGATIDQRVLSGFNRLHRYNEEGGSDPEEFRVVYAVDRTNTTAAAWMGMTFVCAQCHDHKYDPISQREYYQLLAFFNSLKGEITVSKGPANPPQIRVPDPQVQEKINTAMLMMAQLEPQLQMREESLRPAFEKWLNASRSPQNNDVAFPAGAIGGRIGRTAQRAWYADTHLADDLTLETPLHSSGRLTVVRSINNDVEVGHFSTAAAQGVPGTGFCVAEGPRLFAHIAFSDGTVVHSSPIAAEHGIEYSWRSSYDPHEGKITLEVLRNETAVGTTSLVLTPAQRSDQMILNAFGISFRGLDDRNSPIELFLDDIEYTVSSSGSIRLQNCDQDPNWSGNGNQPGSSSSGTIAPPDGGHAFGYDPLASTASPDGVSLAAVAALHPEQRTDAHVSRLWNYYLQHQAPDVLQLHRELSNLKQEIEQHEQAAPLALVWEEMEVPRPTQILIRGDFQQPGEIVERGVPAIFPELPSEGTRDRLTLARWLVSGRHPLTARVAVNRFWKQVFGAGLVRTADDFGVRGEPPTHPELLDWLAVEFQSESADHVAWDIRKLLRLMVTSATYRQSSATSRELKERDPDNRLLARGSRFRLTAEEIRDAALTSSGLLNRAIGGRSVYPYQPDHFYRDKEDDPNEWKWPVETGSELYRRGLYTFIRRTSPYPSFQTFDVSGRGECMISRARTNTPLQALVTLNDPGFFEAARVLAERTMQQAESSLSDRIRFAFRSVLTRTPAASEETLLSELYKRELLRFQQNPAAAAQVMAQGRAPRDENLNVVEAAAWATVANALFNLDEAITRE